MKAQKYDQYQSIIEGELESWHVGGDSRAHQGGSDWTVATRNPCYTIARAHVETERRVIPADRSLTGQMAVRIRTEVTITLRLLGYQEEFTLNEPYVVYSGPRTALRQTMRSLQNDGSLWIHAKLDMEYEARKLGASEFAILETWDSNNEMHLSNLYRLIERQRNTE